MVPHAQAALEIDNILKHGVNNILILLDVALTRQPFVTYHYQVSCPARRGCQVLSNLILSTDGRIALPPAGGFMVWDRIPAVHVDIPRGFHTLGELQTAAW